MDQNLDNLTQELKDSREALVKLQKEISNRPERVEMERAIKLTAEDLERNRKLSVKRITAQNIGLAIMLIILMVLGSFILKLSNENHQTLDILKDATSPTGKIYQRQQEQTKIYTFCINEHADNVLRLALEQPLLPTPNCDKLASKQFKG